MKNILSVLIFILIALFFISCGDKPANVAPNKNTATSPKTNAPLPINSFEVVRKYKHDGEAFTEGLFFYNGFLYESTGLDGKSDLRKVEIETGKVVQKVPRFTIYPSSHYVTPRPTLQQATKGIRAELQTRLRERDPEEIFEEIRRMLQESL